MFCQPMTSLLFSVRSRAYRGATLIDFGRVEADRLDDDRAPAFVERFADDVGVRARRAGADDEGVGQFDAVYRCF